MRPAGTWNMVLQGKISRQTNFRGTLVIGIDRFRGFFCLKIVVKRSISEIKFTALVVPKLGEAVIWRVLATKIVGGRLSESDLNSYGELIAR
mgnify:CR=1 FL=1